MSILELSLQGTLSHIEKKGGGMGRKGGRMKSLQSSKAIANVW